MKIQVITKATPKIKTLSVCPWVVDDNTGKKE
jgi:hypothetical protein